MSYGPSSVHWRVDRNRQAVRIVGAGVAQEPVAHAEDAPVLRQRHLGLVHLSALLRRRVEVLLPILGPLERPLEPHRRPRQQQLLRVEHHDLRPEPAADERRDDAHLRFEQAEHLRQAVPDRNRRLRRVPDRQLLGPRIPFHRDGAVLDRGGDAAVVQETGA